ncbi:transcription elongation factor spt4 [Malassezia vespertilionis]|uniref:Transcription elongation factor SPT4 n=1 Tax=Malassezia vespertilionis TaxID=2020962 RepID=A0A2N1JBZ0_9BASI|nr:transcription elongation factor spt4 [Malassezia vespertilionis]PKI84074.1 Spt4p [Malassezia vespertilionis]WFD06788.1 transcription elongation factor spt4 [Malassezia vespertilionis]
MSSTNTAAKLRACLRCQYAQSAREFHSKGCPNCQNVLDMQGSQERVADCTTSNFDGLICMLQPEESWVAKWQRIEKRMVGLYAVKVVGHLPEGYE